MESFHVELKTLTVGKLIKNSSKIATYSFFIGPAGVNCINVRSVNTEFHKKKPQYKSTPVIPQFACWPAASTISIFIDV